MPKNLIIALQAIYKKAWLKLALVILTIATIGLSTLSHSGISSDEVTEIRMVQQNIDLVTKGQPIKGDIVYYGPVFNFTAEAVFQAQEYIRYGSLKHPLNCQVDSPCFRSSMTERIKVKHFLTFLSSLIGYLSVAGIIGILCGCGYAWFGPIVLALFPRFWGDSFFNPKDIPFAALFTLCTFAGAYLINQYLQTEERIKIGFNRIIIHSVLYGVLVGLLSSTRLGGFLVLFFIPLSYGVLSLRKETIVQRLMNGMIGFPFMFIGWVVTMILCNPASWSNPLGWLISAIRYLSKHGWPKNVLFNGQYIKAADIPWTYLPTWLIITIPLVFLISLLTGLVFIGIKFPKFSTLQRACAVLVLLQVFFLPLLAMVRGSTIYDGMRQFMFVVPGIAAIAAATLIWIYQKLTTTNLKIFAVALIAVIFSAIVFDMAALHPYEYLYFNRVSGGLANAQGRYETDYWGLTVKEAVEWLNANSEPNTRLVVSTPHKTTLITSDPDIDVIEINEFEYDYRKMKLVNDQKVKQIPKPFYYLAIPKHKLQYLFTECQLVHQVARQGVPFTTIRRCE